MKDAWRHDRHSTNPSCREFNFDSVENEITRDGEKKKTQEENIYIHLKKTNGW